MTPYESVLNRLPGKPVCRIPNLNNIMTFHMDDAPQCKQNHIESYTNLKKLTVRNPLASERMLDRVIAVELFISKSAGHFPALGWADGAFAESAFGAAGLSH